MVSQKLGREGMLDWCTVAEKGELDTNQYSATPTLLNLSRCITSDSIDLFERKLDVLNL